MIGSQNLFLSLCYPSGTHGFPQKKCHPSRLASYIDVYIYRCKVSQKKGEKQDLAYNE